jgi:heat shock protein HtpX
MIVVILVGSLSLIGDQFLRINLGARKKDSKNGDAMVIVGIIFLILAPVAGELIKLAISRKREYLADASGSLLTRFPEGLARALEKIQTTNIPLERTSTATNHLWIAEPYQGNFSAKIFQLFSTHPPIEDRIAKLRSMTDLA